LRRCGFEDVQFLLPFPDYKTPTSIVNGDRATARVARACNLVDWCRQPYVDHSHGESQAHMFNPHLALHSFAENGLLADVANSFLVLVSKTALSAETIVPRAQWIARKLNTGRRPQFRSMVTLEESQGGTVIRKEIAARTRSRRNKQGRRRKATAVLHDLTRSITFIEATHSLSFLLLQALHRTEDREVEFKRLLEGWISFLIMAAPDPQQPTVLPSRFVDCIPANLLVDPAGAMHYVDDEWSWREPVELEWVIMRGLLQFWRDSRQSILGRIVESTAGFDDFLTRCLELTGLDMQTADLKKYQGQEDHFQKLVVTVAGTCED